ncbi:MAG: hypothetical protein LUI12_01030 [Clostridiales bacterium]|nr:hypothetical protein [Clostridiales bacterium]
MTHKRKIAAALSALTLVSAGIIPNVTAADNDLLTLYIDSYAAYRNGEMEYIDADNVDVTPVVRDDRTLVPVRYIGEAFSCAVSWDDETQTAQIQSGSDKIEIGIGNDYININGTLSAIDVPVQLIEERTMVPLRALAEALGKSVDYYNDLIMIGSDGDIQSLKSGDLDAYITEHFKNNMALNKSLTSYDTVYTFRRVCEYGDMLYTTPFAGNDGAIRFVEGNVGVTTLNVANYIDETIYDFTIYNDKVYYLAGNAGSDYLPASIYSCDIDGSNIQCIVDDTCNWFSCWIVNNELYYTTFDMDWESYNFLPNSINKINLSTLEKTVLVQEDSTVVYMRKYFDGVLLYNHADESNRPISYHWYDLTDGSSGIYNSEITYGWSNSKGDVVYTDENYDIILQDAYSGETTTLVSDGWGTQLLYVTDEYVYYGKLVNEGFNNYCITYRVEI